MAKAACSSCGKQVVRGRDSRPEIVCQECRRQKPSYIARQQARTDWSPVTLDCPTCGEAFSQQRYGQQYCSIACRNRHHRSKPKSEAAKERDRKRIRPPRTCPRCGEQYHPTCGDQKYCSRQCGRRMWPSSRVYFPRCATCDQVFCVRSRRRKLCSPECAYERMKVQINARIKERYRTDPAFRDRVLAAAHARRADKLGLEGRTVLLSYLIKRDKGRCGICHRPVRAKRGPMRPSIDHIIPLSMGGTHDLANVQLAHYRCNLEKHNGHHPDGDGEQLMLIG